MRKCSSKPLTPKSGFTLIELMASVAILMILVWVLAAIFRESDRAWAMGTGRIDNSMEGRAVLQMMANDLQYAICSDTHTFIVRDQKDRMANFDGNFTYGHTNSEVCFVTLSEDASPSGADKRRATREMIYYVSNMGSADPILENQYRVMRSLFSSQMLNPRPDLHSYYDPEWYEENRLGKVAAEHIIAFGIYVPDPTDPTGKRLLREYDTANPRDYRGTLVPEFRHQLPRFVDIFVEVLNAKESEQLAQIMSDPLTKRFMESSGDLDRFIEQNARRYTRRVFFQNRIGYMPRGDYPNRNP